MEWVTNHLLDSTALGSEDSDGEEPKDSSDSAGRLANSVGSVLRLATLCSEVLKSLSHVDSDDLEMQVIQAAQTRLQRIEKFNWGRLLSVHSDRAQFGGDDLSINNFTGTVSADECWEWIPSQDSLEYVQPLMASPVTPVKTPPAFTLDREPWRAKHKVPELRTPVKQPRSPRSASFLRRSDSLSLAPKPGPASAALSPLEEYLQSAGGEARSPVKVATGPNQVVVPTDFIQQLELMFGPLQRPEPDQDLPLDDILARKIYNCLKLQANKKSFRSPEEEQLQADEEYARFLQEQEDQKNAEQGQVATGLSIPQGSTPGWTNQRPTWMSSGLEAQTKWESEHRQYHQTHSQHVGSVSSVLHELRGTKGKKLKPTKFRPAVPTTDLNSVWHNSSKGKQPENFQSIMREEREREDLLQEKMSKLHASEGGIDLATKLKRRQLGDMYPMLSSELLDEIFFQNNCSKEDSIEALTLTYGMTPVLVPREQEESHVYSQMRNEVVPEEEEWEPRFSAVEPTASLSYDDLRSEAHLYRRLAKECQDKALRYQSDGMAAAAFFYRQQVKKYKDEEMAANQRAAHVLFEKRHERLDRENLLDLHFYHLEEAKMAVDRAIIMKEEESVANPGKKNSSLYVVTGRGRNSKGGVAKLKPGIIGHLRVRGLRFEDASPGMLKVYLGQRI
ncbi:uncharacterized protein LOC101859763 [Aplysia californica]|uniref:Uncharacterized protein LOC101859763 n=1 Tax=Aplysia californica TaxID=6500 RepID=A0ABM0KBC8_APLCA|nr:uncharacterized protein LOC101859763 [Aplysia californica]